MKYRLSSVDDVPEERGLFVHVGGRSIAVFRNEGGFFAIDDICPHKGGSLHEGALSEGVVSCPWHHWQFDLRTGECPINPHSKVDTFHVWTEGNDLYVEI
jgi:NAD(P)H-dependent nitrite reductase small subunit